MKVLNLNVRNRQILFVCFAFILMIAISFTATNNILRRHLAREAEELLRTAELTIASNLRESATTLVQSAFTIKRLIADGESHDVIHGFMVDITDWLENNEDIVYGFYGIYGLVQGEFLDGTNWEPPAEYVPQERPWYIVAKEKYGELAETVPYVDAQTGDVIISYSQEIINDRGESFGVLSIDVHLEQLGEYVKTLRLSDLGYGILINQEFEIIAHPNADYVGRRIESINNEYADVQAMLAEGKTITSISLTDSNNVRYIAFFRQLYNGWYIGSMTPFNVFYRDLYLMALVMLLVGAALMFTLSLILYRQHRRMEINNNAVIQLMESLAEAEKEKHRIEIAEASSKAKTEFLAAMSHEIRTPMNAIIGITQIQMQKEELPKDYSQALYKIYASSTNLLGIINDILDISKIEAGKFEINSAEYDVSCLINDSVQLNILRIGSKEIKFLVDVDENLPSRLCGDELRLKQILNNLLSNGIKYTEKGFVKLSVSHLMENSSDIILRFTVEDTGQGMKAEDQELLFSEYMRFNTAANRTTEGTGLGLNITRKLVEMMDGTIQVQSERGKGSTFIIEVKQQAVDCGIFDIEPIGAETAEKLNNFTFSGDKQMSEMQFIRYPMPYGKVLVVDDLPANLYVAEGLLAPYKLNIEMVESGFAAIEKIESGNDYDIIFMDHMMPIMDGVQATQNLRAQGYTGVIVALTANALAGNEQMFKQKGFDGFIAKPIDLRQLDSALNTFIREKYPEEAAKYNSSAEFAMPKHDKDPMLIKIFCGDAKKAIVTLRETIKNGDIKLFTSSVHSLKPVLAHLGETKTAEAAFNLEKAGLGGDNDFIHANTEDFITTLENLIQKLCAETPVDSESVIPDDSNVTEDTVYLTSALKKIQAACEDYNAKEAYAILDQLKEKPWKVGTTAALEKIRDTLFLHSDFEGACEHIVELKKGL